MAVRRSIIFEGWRNLPHSYCVVSTAQIARLLGRDDLALYFVDLPPTRPEWRAARGLFAPDVERAVDALAAPPDGLVADAVIRTAHPYRMDDAPNARRTIVQGTSEYGAVFDNFVSFRGQECPLRVAHAASSAIIVTCSKWSADGFLRSGAKADRLKIVHLGVDPAVFCPPSDSRREKARAGLGIVPDDFVFLSIGAMTPNKNVNGMLSAFGKTLLKNPRARLILKGTDALFDSGALVDKMLAKFDTPARAVVKRRLTYIGAALDPAGIVALHHAADAYLAPYRAEGFCLPALEAAACGLPVIVTRGGPTDEFTTSGFALQVKSERRWHPTDGWLYLEPDGAALLMAMQRVMSDARLRARARAEGPAHAGKFTWRQSAERLLEVALE